MDFKELVKARRSHRLFTEEMISPEDLRTIVRAALMAPTSKNRRDWKFHVVEDRDVLRYLSRAKDAGAALLDGAAAAVVVCGLPSQNDCWVEDCSIAAVSMQYQAEELGLGSCWVQMRGRGRKEGETLALASESISALLSLEEGEEVLCVVAFGHKGSDKAPQNEEKLLWDRVDFR